MLSSVSQLITFYFARRFFCTLKLEAIRPSENSVLTRATRCHIPEDGILHSHRRETWNLTFALFIKTEKNGHAARRLTPGATPSRSPQATMSCAAI
jgi:hypothetical protein